MIVRKKRSETSEISTAALPDIVFLLLFFFMVTATIKPKDEQVKLEIPKAQAISSVQRKFLVKELHVGIPKRGELGTTPRISAGNQLIELSQIGHWVEQEKAELEEVYRDQMIILLKADKDVEMGLINDIQQQLRKHNARKMLFGTLEETELL